MAPPTLSPFGLWKVGQNRYYVHWHQAVIWQCAQRVASPLMVLGALTAAAVVVLTVLGLFGAIQQDMFL